jgi:HAE1 family hydrophobic/amphiphilic exporter-1
VLSITEPKISLWVKRRCSRVFQTSGSNAQDITTEIMSILEESKPDFPSGIDYIIPYNSKTFLDASINKVIYTLIEAFLLVFLVVYLFLQDFKSTLIPAIAVPVAIIGTFSSCKYLVSRSTC